MGSNLVKKGIQKAEKAGVPFSLCAEPQAHDFFEHQGFKEKKYVDIDLAKWAPKHTGFGNFRLYGMAIAN
jgi:N-acetylglutamate synthase-like GNAT family acetyltransferase